MPLQTHLALEEAGIFNGFQFIIRCHHAFIGIDFLVFAFNIGNGLGKKAGAMVVNIRKQCRVIEFIDYWCPALRDMCITKQFPDHGTIFTFY